MLNIQQLQDELERLPSDIRAQQLNVIEKTKKLEEAELRLKVAEGLAILESKGVNATLRKAEAAGKTKDEERDVIEAKYNLAKEVAGFKYLDNRFTSLRKISSIEIEMAKQNISGQ